jgi:hypothetical protein
MKITARSSVKQVALFLFPIHPVARSASLVSNGQNANEAGFRRVIELVGESPQHLAPHATALDWRSLGELLDERHGLLHIRCECLDCARCVQAEIGDYLEVLRLRLGMESRLSGR